MSPAVVAPRRGARARPVAVAALAALLLPTAAHAQFGGLVRRGAEGLAGKRVERTIEERTGAKPADAPADGPRGPVELLPPTFDATWVEITQARLDGYLRARAAVAAESPARVREMDGLRARAEGLDADARRLFEGSTRERETWNAATARWEECATAARDALAARQQADDDSGLTAERAMAAAMSGAPVPPGVPPEVAGLIQRLAAASRRGDQAEVTRLTQQFAQAMQKAEDEKERAAVQQRCGAAPARPAALQRQEALEAQARALRARADSVAVTLQAGPRAGLSARQEAMMLERMQAYLRPSDYPISRTFTRAEWELLGARRSEVAGLFTRS